MHGQNEYNQINLNSSLKTHEIPIEPAKFKSDTYFKKLKLFVIFFTVVASSYLFDHRPESISIQKALLALGITWIGLIPSLQFLSDHHRPPLPFFPLVGIFYATSFGLPMFYNEVKIADRSSLANVSEQALLLVLLGVLEMTIAFYFSKFTLFRKVSPIFLPKPYQRNKLLTILWIFLILHTASLYIRYLQEIPSLGQLLIPFGYMSYGTFYLIWSQGKLSNSQTWIILGLCLPLECIPRLASGALAQILTLGLFIIILVWYETKRIPIISISILLIVFTLLNPVKSEYRALTWGTGRYAKANPIEKVQLFADLAVKHYTNMGSKSQPKGSVNSATDSAIERTALIILFSNVIEDTPKTVPYWKGASYVNLFTSFIPRAFWPDKPIERVGNEFGRRYGYLGVKDYATSINLPWIVEMYVNFGKLGVALAMPLLGFILAFINQKLNSDKMDSLEVVMGSTVLFPLIYQESNFSLMTGNVLTLFLSLYLIFKFVLGKPATG